MRSPLVPLRKRSRTSSSSELPRRLEVDVVLLGDGLGDLLVVLRRRARPRRQRALADRQRRIGHDQLGVDLHLRAEPRAALARAVRRVEGEDPRLELGDDRPVVGAGELLRVQGDRALPFLGDGLDLDHPVGQRHGGLDRVGQALAQVAAHDEAVDHDRDVVLVLLVEDDLVLEHPQLAVDLRPREALRAQLLEDLAVLALAPAHERRQHHEARALLELHDLVDDLLGGLPGDRLAADVAVRMADARPQQAQVVVDLGDRADRRARVARRRLLVDRDGRRQALDRVDVGLVHLAQELPRVRAERLDIAPLALGVDRVEGQRGLARSRQPRDDHERVARERERDVLEVVLARAGDDDRVAWRH